MAKYIIKRILLALLVLFGVSVFLYFLLRLMPTNAIIDRYYTQVQGGTSITEADLQRMLAIYGLDDSSFGGIIKGYFKWLGNFLKGDMGKAFSGDDVSYIISSKMGISFGISFVSLILEVIIAIPLGIKCACNQYGKLDYTATVLCMVGIAFPAFFLGNILIKIFAVDLGWFPISGMNDPGLGTDVNGFVWFVDLLWHLVLPLFVMTILSIGSLMRYTRTNTLEVLNADYIRTARAKGLSEGKVVYKHVFRNTLIPLVTVLAATLPTLFGGAMITEEVFAIDGIGRTAYNALKDGDVALAMSYNMFLAVLTVIGTLLADILYVVVDPRVKLGK